MNVAHLYGPAARCKPKVMIWKVAGGERAGEICKLSNGRRTAWRFSMVSAGTTMTSLQEVGCCVARRRRYEQRFQNALEANGSYRFQSRHPSYRQRPPTKPAF
jgi:hypothetical protein